MEYLGHILGYDGVQVDPKMIQAMQDWPRPKTLKIPRGFLGLTGYYRKFVHNYAKITNFPKRSGPSEAFPQVLRALSNYPMHLSSGL